jgi:peptide/nickel transport system substrate-binding protein
VATFARHENYWVADRPYIDEIESIGIGDENARVSALLTGEVDLVQNLNAKLVKQVEASGVANAVVTVGTAHAAYPMRADTAPFDNEDVRTALKHAFDRQRFIDIAFDGYGGVGRDHPVPPQDPDFCQDVPLPTYDPDKVKFHLKRAGHENTVFEFNTSDAVYGGSNAAVVIGELMREAGVNVQVKRNPTDGYWDAIYMKAPWCASAWLGQPTATGILENGYHSQAKWNETFWNNSTFDNLIAAAKVELDDAKRRQILCDAQMLLSQHGSTLIPVFVPWLDGRSVRVKGFKGHPREALGGGQWQDVWLEDA